MYALETIGDTRAVPPVAAVLNSENYEQAVSCLKKIGGSEAKKILVAALKEKDSNISESAAKALSQMGWKPRTDNDQIDYLVSIRRCKVLI
jgi:HEAT repeat protein